LISGWRERRKFHSGSKDFIKEKLAECESGILEVSLLITPIKLFRKLKS